MGKWKKSKNFFAVQKPCHEAVFPILSGKCRVNGYLILAIMDETHKLEWLSQSQPLELIFKLTEGKNGLFVGKIKRRKSI